jgi:hypothetical protein
MTASDYSPLISFGVGDEKFTLDWSAFALHEDRWKTVFKGNALDLGAFDLSFSHLLRLTRSILLRNRDPSRQTLLL